MNAQPDAEPWNTLPVVRQLCKEYDAILNYFQTGLQ